MLCADSLSLLQVPLLSHPCPHSFLSLNVGGEGGGEHECLVCGKVITIDSDNPLHTYTHIYVYRYICINTPSVIFLLGVLFVLPTAIPSFFISSFSLLGFFSLTHTSTYPHLSTTTTTPPTNKRIVRF